MENDAALENPVNAGTEGVGCKKADLSGKRTE